MSFAAPPAAAVAPARFADLSDQLLAGIGKVIEARLDRIRAVFELGDVGPSRFLRKTRPLMIGTPARRDNRRALPLTRLARLGTLSPQAARDLRLGSSSAPMTPSPRLRGEGWGEGLTGAKSGLSDLTSASGGQTLPRHANWRPRPDRRRTVRSAMRRCARRAMAAG